MKLSRPIQFRCACGEMLQPMRVSGETSASCLRECKCGLSIYIELTLDCWDGLKPVYKLEKVSVL